MTGLKKQCTPRAGLPLTEERTAFLRELRDNPLAMRALPTAVKAHITPETPESVLVSAIFDAGVRSLRENEDELSYAAEAGEGNFRENRGWMRGSPRDTRGEA